MRFVQRFARKVDDEFAAAWRERRRIVAAKAASAGAAEHARTLHDTAINTLAAVASGAATQDVGLVRELCRAAWTRRSPAAGHIRHSVVACVGGRFRLGPGSA